MSNSSFDSPGPGAGLAHKISAKKFHQPPQKIRENEKIALFQTFRVIPGGPEFFRSQNQAYLKIQVFLHIQQSRNLNK
jgi:hypothetical protein